MGVSAIILHKYLRVVMIHLAYNPADQHEQAHDNGHQALQNSKACSLLLFFGSDRV